MNSALVLDGHSAAAVETVQCLGRHGIAVDVAGSEASCLAARSRYTREFFVQPSAVDGESFPRWLRELDARKHYRLIVPSTEASLLAMMLLAETDPLRGKAVIPSKQALMVALDKHATANLAAELGVAVPSSVLIESLNEAVTPALFPLILKPVRSKVLTRDGDMVTLTAVPVRDDAQWQRELRRLLAYCPVLQQQYVEGSGVGVELLYDRGQLVWYFAHQRLHELPLTGGASTYRRSIEPDQRMLDASRALLDALHWHGVAMVEFRASPNGEFRLLEINPRLWGSLALALDAGVEFPLGLYRIAGGELPGPQPRYRINYRTRNLLSDLKWMRANLRADRANPLIRRIPPLKPAIEYLRPLLGSESWDHFSTRDPAVILATIGGALGAAGAALRRRLSARLEAHALRREMNERLRLKSAAPIREILFVCYGNICRSPFAEQVARMRLRNCRVTSTGFYKPGGRVTPEHVMAAARSLGFNLDSHRSCVINREMVEQADLILLMDSENYHALTELFPGTKAKALLLGTFNTPPRTDIADPYGSTLQQTVEIFQQISAAIDGLSRWLATPPALS